MCHVPALGSGSGGWSSLRSALGVLFGPNTFNSCKSSNQDHPKQLHFWFGPIHKELPLQWYVIFRKSMHKNRSKSSAVQKEIFLGYRRLAGWCMAKYYILKIELHQKTKVHHCHFCSKGLPKKKNCTLRFSQNHTLNAFSIIFSLRVT